MSSPELTLAVIVGVGIALANALVAFVCGRLTLTGERGYRPGLYGVVALARWIMVAALLVGAIRVLALPALGVGLGAVVVGPPAMFLEAWVLGRQLSSSPATLPSLRREVHA
jgi:hypothetical protein